MLVLLCLAQPASAVSPLNSGSGPELVGSSPHTPGLVFNSHVSNADPLDFLKRKRRKRRRKRTLAVGAVVGGPVGLGARGLLRLGSFGISGDLAYNRIRSDAGPLVSAFTSKIDARFYSKSFFGKLLRFYVFGGATLQRGKWDEVVTQSAFLMDAGLGGGIKISRISVNAEAGLLIPAVQLESYKPGFGVFANIAILLWLF